MAKCFGQCRVLQTMLLRKLLPSFLIVALKKNKFSAFIRKSSAPQGVFNNDTFNLSLALAGDRKKKDPGNELYALTLRLTATERFSGGRVQS